MFLVLSVLVETWLAMSLRTAFLMLQFGWTSNQLADRRIRFLRVDAQFLHGALHHIGSNFLLPGKRCKGGQYDVFGVDLEEVAQGGTILAAAKAIGAERNQLARYPLAQAFRQNLHVIGCRDEGSRRVFQRLRDVGHLRRLSG